MRSTKRYLGSLGLAALAAAACSDPPSETLSQAREAEQLALAAGASEYAPEALDAVAEARAALDAELAAQGERWALRRSYDRAEDLARAYRMASVEAASAAQEGRDEAHDAATLLIFESRALLAEVTRMLSTAPVGKGTAADLAALRADLGAAAAGLDSAESAMLAERYHEAEVAAASARDLIDSVQMAIEQARGIRRAG